MKFIFALFLCCIVVVGIFVFALYLSWIMSYMMFELCLYYIWVVLVLCLCCVCIVIGSCLCRIYNILICVLFVLCCILYYVCVIFVLYFCNYNICVVYDIFVSAASVRNSNIIFAICTPLIIDFGNIRGILKYHKCVLRIHHISTSSQPEFQPLNRIIKEVTALWSLCSRYFCVVLL